MAKVNISTGSNVVLVDEHNNEVAALVGAVLEGGRVNLHAFPAGSSAARIYNNVPHYNDVRGQKTIHWKKPA